MAGQNVRHPYTGVLIRLKKEGNSDTCYNMDEPCKHYAKQKTSNTKGKCIIPCRGGKYCINPCGGGVTQSTETASRTEVVSAGNSEL